MPGTRYGHFNAVWCVQLTVGGAMKGIVSWCGNHRTRSDVVFFFSFADAVALDPQYLACVNRRKRVGFCFVCNGRPRFFSVPLATSAIRVLIQSLALLQRGCIHQQ